MLHRVAPGRGGGDTYATPPRGQSTIWFALPPTCRHASAWPNSCNSTIRNSARYSSTGQAIEEYLPARMLMPYTAIRNQDQCKYTSTPAKRNRRKDPCRVGVIGHHLTHRPARQQAFICHAALPAERRFPNRLRVGLRQKRPRITSSEV